MADEWGVAPVMVAPKDDWGVAPVSSDPPPVMEPKPSLLRRGVNIVGGAIAELPQVATEAVVAPVNAMVRGLRYVVEPTSAFLGSLSGGSSFGESVEAGESERRKIAQSHALNPSPLGQSWLGQGIGYGVNSLVERGLISPESAQGAGDILALASMRVTGPPLASGLRTSYNKLRTAVPSTVARAGELWEKTKETLPGRETEQVAARRGELATAQQELGVERLPYTADPNIRIQQLAAERVSQNLNVRAKDVEFREVAVEQADSGLGAVIPRENIDSARLSFVGKKLEANNAAAKAAAETTTKVGKENLQRQVENAALGELDKVEAVIPKTGRLDLLPMGQKLLQRLRGEDGDTGIRAVQKVFNEEYGKFDVQGATASSADLLDAVKSSADVSTESGRVLRGFVDEAKKIERRLGEEVATDGIEGSIPAFPETLTLKQFRGLKGEFSRAAELARKADNRPAAMELNRLSEVARQGENAAIERLGPEAVERYNMVRDAYKNVFIKAMRQGHGGELTGFGKEVGGYKIPPARVFKTLLDRQNANDLMLAFGAEEAAKSGKLLAGLNEADLVSMGRKGAQEAVRPYVEGMISTIYKDAKGGKRGVAAVEKYLNAHTDTLKAYGLPFDELRSAATNYNEVIARITGAKTAAAKGVVEGIVKQTDPTKLGSYVFDNANPQAAYSNLLGVSKDPLWKPSIDTLMIDELKARIDAGKDVFADVKTVGAMEGIWSKPQIAALRKYHTIMRQMQEKPVRTGGGGLPEHPLDRVVGAGQAFPVGYGSMYAVKYFAKFLAKLKIIGDDEAAWRYIDDALINPEKAKVIEEAYRGRKAAQDKLKQEVSLERKSVADLAKIYGTKAAAGAIAKPKYADMDDSTFMATP